jgi:hypothetical protein
LQTSSDQKGAMTAVFHVAGPVEGEGIHYRSNKVDSKATKDDHPNQRRNDDIIHKSWNGNFWNAK